METGINREAQLLLALARIDLGEDHRIEMERLLREGVEWGRVVEIAKRNEVTPFLHHHLRSSAPDGLVPAGLLASLERGYHANAYRNERLLDNLSRVLGAFREAGIDVIVLKGCALLSEVYRGLPLRKMVDIDLLVREGPVCERAKGVLFDLGFDYHHSQKSYCIGEETRFGVELHTGIMTDHLRFFTHTSGKLWERAGRRKIAGVDTFVLCPEDLLLHLCIHATYQHFFKLKFFIDIAELIKTLGESFLWEELMCRDSKYQIGSYTYTALNLCHRLLGAPVPAHVLEAMRRESPRILIRHLDGIDPTLLPQRVGRESLQSGILYLMASKTASERTRYLTELLFLPRNKMSQLYGVPVSSWRLYLKYGIRPLQLFLKLFLPAMKFVMRK